MGQRNLKAGIAMWGSQAEIVYRSFPLMSDLAPGSDTRFLEMFGRQRSLLPEQVWNIMDGVTRKAATLGLELRFDRARATNTLRAQELAHFAKSKGKQDLMADRLFKAYFTDGLLLGDLDTLARLAAEIGLDHSEASRALAEKRFVHAVKADIATADRLGVTGVPYVSIGGTVMIAGDQPPEAFAEALSRAQASNKQP